MVKTGIHIVPWMDINDVLNLAMEAENLGYDYCLVADEGFMPDVYVTLGAIARQTSRLRLGPVTNGYTRHPAVTASAVATLNVLSGGRALAALVAGGSMVLPPMGIARETPLTVVRETVEIMRRLWTGDSITWQGERYRLEAAQTVFGPQRIPIWLAGRGPRMLALAGEQADGVILTIKSDLGPALEIMAQSIPQARCPERIYLGNLAYTRDMLDEVVDTLVYVIKDAPARVLKGFGLEDNTIAQIRQAIAMDGPAASARFITPDLLRKYQIAGTPTECSLAFHTLVNEHNLDVFLLDIVSPDLRANLELIHTARSIINRP